MRENDNTQLTYFTLQGDQIRIKNMKDLFLYSYVTDFQAWYVVENQVCLSAFHFTKIFFVCFEAHPFTYVIMLIRSQALCINFCSQKVE